MNFRQLFLLVFLVLICAILLAPFPSDRDTTALPTASSSAKREPSDQPAAKSAVDDSSPSSAVTSADDESETASDACSAENGTQLEAELTCDPCGNSDESSLLEFIQSILMDDDVGLVADLGGSSSGFGSGSLFATSDPGSFGFNQNSLSHLNSSGSTAGGGGGGGGGSGGGGGGSGGSGSAGSASGGDMGWFGAIDSQLNPLTATDALDVLIQDELSLGASILDIFPAQLPVNTIESSFDASDLQISQSNPSNLNYLSGDLFTINLDTVSMISELSHDPLLPNVGGVVNGYFPSNFPQHMTAEQPNNFPLHSGAGQADDFTDDPLWSIGSDAHGESQIMATPEPASVVIWGSGLLCVALSRRLLRSTRHAKPSKAH